VTIVGASRDSVDLSLCGRIIPDAPEIDFPLPPLPVRIFNGIRYGLYLFSYNKAMKKADKLTARMKIKLSDDPQKLYKNINKGIDILNRVTAWHYVTSAHSGSMSSAVILILKKEGKSDEETRAILACLLEDIDDIESVDILRSLRRIAREALKKNGRSLTAKGLAEVIKSDTGDLREAYDAFLALHGHRCIRESELRQKSWRRDETGLMETILSIMRSGAEETGKASSLVEERIENFLAEPHLVPAFIFRLLIRECRKAVYNREFTKSKFVLAIDKIKEAYAALAELLVKKGLLPDADLIYFLTHDEAGLLIREGKRSLIKTALRRRRLLDEQAALVFNEVYIGKPEPVKRETAPVAEGALLKGTPLSRGEAKGKARVIRSVEDANALEPDEIMVAAFTDIGWSPWYSLVKALVTEVGSALSHGAVVAREYALPVVSNISGATARIRTGDFIHVNGSSGEVVILESTNPPV